MSIIARPHDKPCLAWHREFRPRALTRALRSELRSDYPPKSGQLVPAARIDGAECARVLCRCAECGASAFGLTPKRPRRRPRQPRGRRWRKLLVLDRCRVGLFVPRGGARHRARGWSVHTGQGTQVRCRRRLQVRRPDASTVARKRRRIARRCGTASEELYPSLHSDTI